MMSPKQDELDRILEAGFTHLGEGNLPAARASANAAKTLDPDAAPVYVLFGAVAQGEGDLKGAKASFEQAMTLDPEYFEPILLCAEAAEALGETREAMALLGRALDVAEEEEEFLDALLTKAELEISSGDPEGANATLDELPPPADEVRFPDPVLHLRAGDLLLALERAEEAEAHFLKAALEAPTRPDALYGAGLCAEARGDRPKMIEHFLEVRSLDAAAPPLPWQLDHDRMERLVEGALAELPEKARALLGNVPICVEDLPALALVSDGLDPRLLGLFAGVPYPEQSTLSAPVPQLEQITLYQRNLERAVQSEEELEAEVRTTLLHETGHFFGLDEAALERLGLA
jgi:predicted Zn-dependent protease with MMP-like domain